jgi:hypothetical protein
VALLGEMFGDEVFLYGGDSVVKLLELAVRVNAGVRLAPAVAVVKGERRNPQELQILAALHTLKDSLDLIQAPELMFGFRLRDSAAATTQLKRLEAVLDPLFEGQPLLKGRLKRVKVKGKDFLSLTFDGGMVPWNKIPIEDYEEKEGEFKDLVKKLKGLKVTVSLGVRDNYLLLSLGESLELVEKLGTGGQPLAGRPELKPLAKAADKPLLSVGYVSQALRRSTATSADDLDALADLLKSFLDKAPIGDAQRKRIIKDLADLAKEMKTGLVEPGAAMSFSFRTERGQESYDYDYTRPAETAEAKPLTLLHHLGGDPILGVVGRAAYHPDRYRSFVKWVKVVHGHLEEALLGQLEEGQKEEYQKFGKTFYPLLKRLDDITGKMFLPALADGQTAFVLDGKWKSKKWHQMFSTPMALPMPEVGLVLGVSDAALLRKAMVEYRKLFNDTLAAVKMTVPAPIPEIQIPEPTEVKTKNGSLYFYAIPEVLGLEPRVLPTAGLSKQVAVLTLSNTHAERLLERKPLRVEGGPLAELSKPLLAAAYFNSAAFLDMIAPWIEFGVQTGMKAQGAALPPGLDTNTILEHFQVVLEVLKTVRGSTSATFLEDGVTVTHTETVIRDLK